MGNRSRGMIIIMVLVTMFFIPFFYFSIGPVIKKSKMDGTVEAYKVTFEEIYNEGGYDDEGYWEDPYYTYKPTYYYRVNDMEFSYTTSSSSTSKSSYKSEMTIHYDKHNPYNAIAESEISPMIIVMVTGMYVVFMGVFGFLGYTNKRMDEDMNLGQ